VSPKENRFCWTAGPEDFEIRLDRFLASKPIGISRARIQDLIREGKVLVGDAAVKASRRLRPGDIISIEIPPSSAWKIEPEPVPFEVLYEDGFLIVINKPAGIVVHPGAGHWKGTLVQGVMDHCKGLSGIGGVERPGVVHRLDKDTSGVMIMAKDDKTHLALSAQFKAGQVRKNYLAVVHGKMPSDAGTINLPIGRNPLRRKEMTVVGEGGRNAVTLWRRVRDFLCGFSLLSVRLKTGRTHQIRVHLGHQGHPIVGDAVYGYRRSQEASLDGWRKGLLPRVSRQMLHSHILCIRHPEEERDMEFVAPVPEDMKAFLTALEDLEISRKKL